MAETITALRERYQEHGRAIIEVNDALPSFRAAVLDMERICTERLADELASALTRLEALALSPDHQVVDTLTNCVDRLREETDGELSATTSNIRMKRLAAEMERLGHMTHRVADLERALLRAISKRDRLVYEFEQFAEEREARGSGGPGPRCAAVGFRVIDITRDWRLLRAEIDRAIRGTAS